MDLIHQAFHQLFPNQELDHQTLLKYNKKLGDFNANIRLRNNLLQINLNHKWKAIDSEIQIGLIQTLLLKLFAKKYSCRKNAPLFNIRLYNNFVKKIPFLTEKNQTHPVLEQSFRRVNQNYFHGLLDPPNLVWGRPSKAKLAGYNFHNDTVTVSALFQNAPEEILDYLLYHELLHKKQKFYYKGGRNHFHTKKFRQAENLFPRKKEIEKRINLFIRDYKKKEGFSFLGPLTKKLFQNL